MAGLTGSSDPNLLVGPETADDAGVYRIGENCALVETADIITPLVDDPFTFGRIAAANALSDVYAMGGRPVTAMNLVFFPACTLPGEVLRQILTGGKSALDEAEVCLVGGHTVEDQELKYGLSITGLIDPSAIVRNCMPRAGDRIILTKPLGTGIVSTAIKAEMASEESVAEAVRWMCLLNGDAASLMLECGASAATDVTGFGLVGHLLEMVQMGDVAIRLDLGAIPLMSGVMGLVADGMVPAGCYRNRDHYGPQLIDCRKAGSVDELIPLFDPQTSGGLLISLAPEAAERFLALAAKRGMFAVDIGAVTDRGERAIEIV